MNTKYLLVETRASSSIGASWTGRYDEECTHRYQ